MYIYNVKYNGQIIAATDNDEYADQIIRQYMRNNKSMDMSLFEKEPIRFFGELKENKDMQLKVKKVRDNAVLPTRGDEYAAGVDLYACIDDIITLAPHESAMIPTGIACEFPKGYFGFMIPRSSVGAKFNMSLKNTAGILDESYRGEIMMAFRNNDDDRYQYIAPGDRLAQMILLPYVTYDIVETDTLSETERGEGGFGSTGR